MKSRPSLSIGLALLTAAMMAANLVALANGSATADPAGALVCAGFDSTERFDLNLDLVGQDGWLGFIDGEPKSSDVSDGSTGIVEGFFPGKQRQAYVGFLPPAADRPVKLLSLTKPVESSEMEPSQAVIQFSVLMKIIPSANNAVDVFGWSVYNKDGVRLFSIDFDPATQQVLYTLDNQTDPVDTGRSFDPGLASDAGVQPDRLAIAMDFSANLWSATLNDQILAAELPISAGGNTLSLGDIDAEWTIIDPASPGDNFLVFDDYLIKAQPTSTNPNGLPPPDSAPRLEPAGLTAGGGFVIKVFGRPGAVYRVEYTEDLAHWNLLQSLTAPGPEGVFTLADPGSPSTRLRFYRAVEVR